MGYGVASCRLRKGGVSEVVSAGYLAWKVVVSKGRGANVKGPKEGHQPPIVHGSEKRMQPDFEIRNWSPGPG